MFKGRPLKVLLLGVLLSLIIFPANLKPASSLSPPEWVGIYDLGDNKAGLIWIMAPGVSFYKIYRRRDGVAKFTLIGKNDKNQYIDSDIDPGETYYYQLVSVSRSVESSPSKEMRLVPKSKLQIAVKPPEWEGSIILDDGIGLNWSQQDPALVVAYNVYRTIPPSNESELVASTRDTMFVDRRVDSGREYRYRITSIDAYFRESAPSEELVVTYKRRVDVPEQKEAYQWTPKKTVFIRHLYGGLDREGDRFLSPTDVALSDQGFLYVADSGNGSIQVFSKNGRFTNKFTVPPASSGDRSYPLGLAISQDGNIYCSDAYSGRILIFSPGGRLEKVVTFPPGEFPEKVGLLDVCLNMEGQLFVVDNFNHRVAVFNKDMSFSNFFGQPGLEPGKLTGPGFCMIDADGRFLVTESLGARLQFFDSKGRFVKAFGHYAKNVGALARPKGVAMDSRGRIYIADSWQCQIQAFDGDGKYLFTLADKNDKALDLGAPNGIYIDEEDNIYIAERLAHRVQIRHILND